MIFFKAKVDIGKKSMNEVKKKFREIRPKSRSKLDQKRPFLRDFLPIFAIGVSADLAEYSVPNIRPNIQYSVVH